MRRRELPVAVQPPESFLADITFRPRANKLGEWLCPGCGHEDFRLVKTPPEVAKHAHLFEIRCANCRRNAGTGFPC